jgi:hypothetical protein
MDAVGGGRACGLVREGQAKDELMMHEDAVLALAWSKDSEMLATADQVHPHPPHATADQVHPHPPHATADQVHPHPPHAPADRAPHILPELLQCSRGPASRHQAGAWRPVGWCRRRGAARTLRAAVQRDGRAARRRRAVCAAWRARAGPARAVLG